MVPFDRFEVLKKQKFKEVTDTEVKSIHGLKRYVVSLPVGEEFLNFNHENID